MSGFVDLHCHWIAGIDDGAETPEQSLEMLRGLGELGFDKVLATPHMRPGLFDNTRQTLTEAYQRMLPYLGEKGLPEVALASEHYFDDVVYQRVLHGQGLPYPGDKAVLLEFYEMEFPYVIDQLLAELKKRGLTPVIAHPERYRVLWKKPEVLERLLDIGCVALLDIAALVGKYGRKPQHCAEQFLEAGLYFAACSDAHRPADIAQVKRGIERLRTDFGEEEVNDLLSIGPKEILAGAV